MDSTIIAFLAPAALAAFLVYRHIKNMNIKEQIAELAAKGAVFVDVRTPEEYTGGSRPGSINIPLDSLETGAASLDKNRHIVLCCASGMRSGIAAGVLKKLGFPNVTNAGPWQNTL